MISKSVSIVEPDTNYSLLLKNLFTGNPYFPYFIVGIHNNIEGLYNLKYENPDIVLVEINFPGQLPESIIGAIKSVAPNSKVIVLSSMTDSGNIINAIKAGANGYIIKTLNCHTIMNTLYEYSEGGVPLSRLVSRVLVEYFRKNNKKILTKRESEVMDLISKCKSYSEISGELSIGIATTRKHIKNIYRKLNVHKKSDAILIARREKIIIK